MNNSTIPDYAYQPIVRLDHALLLTLASNGLTDIVPTKLGYTPAFKASHDVYGTVYSTNGTQWFDTLGNIVIDIEERF